MASLAPSSPFVRRVGLSSHRLCPHASYRSRGSIRPARGGPHRHHRGLCGHCRRGRGDDGTPSAGAGALPFAATGGVGDDKPAAHDTPCHSNDKKYVQSRPLHTTACTHRSKDGHARTTALVGPTAPVRNAAGQDSRRNSRPRVEAVVRRRHVREVREVRRGRYNI